MNKIDAIVDKNPFIGVKKRALLWKKYLGKVGNECEIFYKVSFGSEPYLIELGDNVKITYGCKFITHDGGVYVLRNTGKMKDAHVYGKIRIGNNVFLGNNVTILPGVSIGDNCIIGAGAIVVKSIECNSVVAGVPARVICSVDEYYDKIKQYALYTGKLSENEKRTMILETYIRKPEKFISK